MARNGTRQRGKENDVDAIVVSADWLAERLRDGSVAAVDTRPPHFYAQGHLPGALSLPDFFLHGPEGAPPADALARRLGQLGITGVTHVVGYDDGAGYGAARLYWVLRYFRHPAVSILDGGITKWRHDGYDWEYTATSPEPAIYEIGEPDESVVATLDDVRAAADRDDAVILDVRTPAEYLGLQVSATRNGHIPGAVNFDWSNNLMEDSDAITMLRPREELLELYASAGATPDKEIIIHCNSGGRSSETFMVLERLGYPRVRNYVAGWQEWGNRGDTPIEDG